MSVLLTPKNLSLLYKGFADLPPFNKYKLPHHNQIEFKVIKDPHAYGFFSPDPLLIQISRSRCGHFTTIAATMLHEMVHLTLYYNHGLKNYDEHNALFYKILHKAANTYNLDPNFI